MIIEGSYFGFVFGVSCNVSAVLKMFPDEWTIVEISNLFRVAGFIAVRLIETGQNRHEIWKRVVIHLNENQVNVRTLDLIP